MYVNEQSVCDLKKKRMIICAKNVISRFPNYSLRMMIHSVLCLILALQVTLLNLFSLNERLEYSVSPDDPNKLVRLLS